METKVDLKSIVLKYGFFLGLASIAFHVLQYVTDLLYTDEFAVSALLLVVWVVISAAILVAALEQYKKDNGGLLTVGDGAKVGVLAGLIAGVLYGGYMLLYTNVLDPNYYDKVVDLAMKQMSAFAGSMSEEQFETVREALYLRKPSDVANFISAFVTSIICSVILGVIIGAIKKSKPIR